MNKAIVVFSALVSLLAGCSSTNEKWTSTDKLNLDSKVSMKRDYSHEMKKALTLLTQEQNKSRNLSATSRINANFIDENKRPSRNTENRLAVIDNNPN